MKRILPFPFLLLFLSANMFPQSSITVETNATLTTDIGTDICVGAILGTGTIIRNGTSCNPVLPVELVSFTGRVDKNTLLLEWSTASEIQNYGFEIHFRSSTTNAWVSIGFVPGHGNSNVACFYSFRHENVPAGRLQYRLKQIDRDGNFEYSKSIEAIGSVPITFALSQNYPNPFNPKTVISYSIASASNVMLKVFDPIGREVALLVHEEMEPGIYTAVFDGSGLSSGVYFYRLDAGSFSDVKQLTILK